LEKRLEERAEAETPKPPDATTPSAGPSEEDKLAALAAERDAVNDQFLRLRAEFDNYRKRVARLDEETRKRAAESLVRDLLPVVDHLELALEHAQDDSGGFVEGVKMVLKQFQDVLTRHGLSAIPAIGEAFNPEVHEALLCEETDDVLPDRVIREHQKGYRLGDKVLRPSKVVVSAAPSTEVSDEAAVPASVPTGETRTEEIESNG